ncbi:hypothetical protein H4696_006359 [Amycolatopsis lexingtonensis]|uniref:Uncharacterized protein n=1 Tax=Amycolatopsis lexingtonensis TaxID=218822 RepID=A0ABR9I7W0_9PSEU|nr:hypothetical protein [Amycolatopsis lexingtonensis]MBE1499259.1 hypothetical protein [Amycolatopsis lexingtonensis]
MRIRIALTLGALVLAGGALSGGVALAAQAQPAPPTSVRPTQAPSDVPTATRAPQPPSAVPAPRETTRAPRTGPAPRVPRAVPAGPTGDLHLPAVEVAR